MAAEAEHEARAERSSVGSPMEGPNQQHLMDVHKNYRVIEKSRQGYHNESENIMRKQEALLEMIVTENRALRDKVETYIIPNCSKLARGLHLEADKFSKMVLTEAQRAESLQASVRDSYADCIDAKVQMGGVFAARNKYKRAVIRAAVCENRLHKATVDLNVVVSQNKVLKKKVEALSEEKGFYDSVKINLEREVAAMEEAIDEATKESNIFYDERNDFEERITDIHEIGSDMRAYNLWKDTEGWAIMDPEPLAKVINPADQFMATERGKPPKECSEEHRLWIEIMALGFIQDVLLLDDPDEVVGAVQQAQRHNNALFDGVNQLLRSMNECGENLSQHKVTITVSPNQTSKTALINRRVEMESTLESILDLLKELKLSDEELFPIIREMRRQVGVVFKEAGCNVEDEEMDYSKDTAATVVYRSGKREPLEVAIVEFFLTIEHFVDQLSGTLR